MKEKKCYQIIGGQIRILRENRGLTQEMLAELVELSRPSIANIEVGRQPIRIHYLYRIANALEVSVHDFLP